MNGAHEDACALRSTEFREFSFVVHQTSKARAPVNLAPAAPDCGLTRPVWSAGLPDLTVIAGNRAAAHCPCPIE